MKLVTAVEEMRRWKRLAKKRAERLHEMKIELITLALLASEKPAFFNPRHAAKARKIRDRVLAEYQHG